MNTVIKKKRKGLNSLQTVKPLEPIQKDRPKLYHRVSHNLKILKDLFVNRCFSYERGKTATDFNCSNGNQYLIDLERQNLIKREWKQTENQRFKVAYIDDNEKAEQILKNMGLLQGAI